MGRLLPEVAEENRIYVVILATILCTLGCAYIGRVTGREAALAAGFLAFAANVLWDFAANPQFQPVTRRKCHHMACMAIGLLWAAIYTLGEPVPPPEPM